MDDDALESSEYYSDSQFFRALRKRKANNDSADVSCESSSKQNKAVELLPVVLESKSDRELKAYSPVFVHRKYSRVITSGNMKCVLTLCKAL